MLYWRKHWGGYMLKKSISFKVLVEALSVLAVVISLVFVGVQMDENTRATRSAIAAETTATISDWYNSMADNADTSRILRAFIADPSTLNSEDRYRGAMKFHAFMLVLQSTFYLEEEGTLDVKIRDSLSQVIGQVGAKNGINFYWEQRRAVFTNKGFIAFVDNALNSDEGVISDALYTDSDEPNPDE